MSNTAPSTRSGAKDKPTQESVSNPSETPVRKGKQTANEPNTSAAHTEAERKRQSDMEALLQEVRQMREEQERMRVEQIALRAENARLLARPTITSSVEQDTHTQRSHSHSRV